MKIARYWATGEAHAQRPDDAPILLSDLALVGCEPA
jgi:hypothetical protein